MELRCQHAPTRVHLQLGHGIAKRVCHPDAGPVEGHADRIGADVEGALPVAVAGPQFGYRVIVTVRHPDVGSVEGYVPRFFADVEGALQISVAGPQLPNGRPSVLPNERSFFVFS